MKRLEIVQIGLGHVGRAVAQIVLEERKRWREQDGLEIVYKAVSDTSGALVGEELLPQAVRLKESGGRLSELGVEPLEHVLLSEPSSGVTRVVVDVAVHGGTYDLDLLGVANGSYLVLSNKGPLSGSSEQYEQLVKMLPDRLWHEATVGAGMPIISTLDYLIESGDEILEIQASPSGTLGFIMSAVEGGRRFSEAVEEYHMLRYLARIPKQGPVTVGLVDEPVESPFGPISGPENVFDFRTRRYSDVTLTIRGPGAGPERTASGVVFDLLDIAHKAVRDDGRDV